MTYYIAPYPYRRVRRWVHPEDYESCKDYALAVNVREENDEFILNAFVPGLKSDELNIHILDDVVTIEGEYKSEDKEYLMRELPQGSFRRTLHLSTPVDAEKADAKITEGVLNLRLPKAESARPKIIKITSK